VTWRGHGWKVVRWEWVAVVVEGVLKVRQLTRW
jgi:hypothetical protein